MKKQTLTVNQIETLKANMRCAVQYHSNDGQYISKKLNQLQDFLRLAFDLHIIDDYSQVDKITKQVIGAGMNELDLIKRTTA